MFLRCVSITVSHVLTGAGTSPCLWEYFSLGGCVGLGSYNIFYNIFGYCTVYFTLGGCFGIGNEQCFWWWCCHSFELGIGPMVLLGRVSSDWWLSSRAHHWQGLLRGLDLSHYLPWTVTTLMGSASLGSSALMVHLGGCDLVLLAGMVLILLTGSPANRVCFLGLMALFSGYSVSAI